MADIEYLLRENSGKLDLNIIKEYFNLFDKGSELEDLLKRIKNAQ
jgi:hypothetical protein